MLYFRKKRPDGVFKYIYRLPWMKIRIGDMVEVVEGKEIGKRGEVELTNKKFNIAWV